MNLYEKIWNVTNSISHVSKNLTVGEGKSQYKAVADADVLYAVKEAEKTNRLLSIVIKEELIEHTTFNVTDKWDNEKIYHAHDVKYTTLFVDLDNPEDRLEVESLAMGWNNGDKGLGMASTYGRKYALLNAYKIVTGEDPDNNANEDFKKTPPKSYNAKANTTPASKATTKQSSQFPIEQSKEKITALYQTALDHGHTEDQVNKVLQVSYKLTDPCMLTDQQYDELLERVQK